MARRSPLDRYPITQKYIMTRGQALTFPADLLSVKVKSEELKPLCEKVKSFDMPVGKTHYIHLLTKKGVYKTTIEPSKIAELEMPKRIVFSLYQQVLSEIRNCQLKDQAAGINANK